MTFTCFTTALHLYPTVEAVVENNVSELHASGQPNAIIKAVHSGPNASKGSPDDAGGLEPIICLATGARLSCYWCPSVLLLVPIMPSSYLWTDMGLVNGGPLKLPWAVTIHKAQGLSLVEIVVDIGKKEFSFGLISVACSHVKQLNGLLLDPPFAFQRLANLANSSRLQE